MKKNIYKFLFLQMTLLIIINLFNIIYSKENEIAICSSAVVLMDASNGQVLYSKNENIKHFPASITKLMTALLSIDNLEPNDKIVFSKNAVFSIEFGSSHIGMKEDEEITVDQALHGLLLMSANEVANGLAEKIDGSIESFANRMNSKAKELGALNTNFVNPHGLHNEDHYTTAYDMALITRELINKDYFLSIMKDIQYEIPPTNITDEIRYLAQQHRMMNEKRSPINYREDVIGGKTGFTNEAGNTLVTIARRDNQTLIAVILDSNNKDMYEDTNILLDYGFDNFKSVTIPADAYKKNIPIKNKNSVIGEANITLKDSLKVSIKNNLDIDSFTFKDDLPNKLKDNVKKGDIIGNVSIYSDEKLVMDSEIIVDEIIYSASNYINIKEEEKISYSSAIVKFIPITLFFGCYIVYRKKAKGHYSRYAYRKRTR